MSDNDIVVHFRREKTYEECAHEKNAIESRGETYNSLEVDRWVYVGETIMSSVPDKDEFVWLNGIHYIVRSRSWSIKVAELPHQPNFDDTHVMITLGSPINTGNDGVMPLVDFRN